MRIQILLAVALSLVATMAEASTSSGSGAVKGVRLNTVNNPCSITACAIVRAPSILDQTAINPQPLPPRTMMRTR